SVRQTGPTPRYHSRTQLVSFRSRWGGVSRSLVRLPFVSECLDNAPVFQWHLQIEDYSISEGSREGSLHSVAGGRTNRVVRNPAGPSQLTQELRPQLPDGPAPLDLPGGCTSQGRRTTSSTAVPQATLLCSRPVSCSNRSRSSSRAQVDQGCREWPPVASCDRR